jgi:hypothetical protein
MEKRFVIEGAKGKKYPYKAWVMGFGFTPTEVEITGPGIAGDWVMASNGDAYHIATQLFDTKADVIGYGWAQIERLQADIDERQARVDKCVAALEEAASK